MAVYIRNCLNNTTLAIMDVLGLLLDIFLIIDITKQMDCIMMKVISMDIHYSENIQENNYIFVGMQNIKENNLKAGDKTLA
jgi:hypothetical protein